MNEIIDILEKTFKDVTDITDPSSMDKVLMILEEMQMQDEEYMEILVSKLGNEAVTWEQPWYQLSYCLTRKPPPSNNDEETYATGLFMKQERDKIEENWKEIVSHYEVPDKPICLARWRNRNRIRNKHSPEEWVRYFVSAYLAQGLKRNLYQVYKYFVQYYAHPVKLKHYTALEEKIMEISFYHRPQDAGIILSVVLGREPRGLYKKLEEYYCGKPDGKRLKWTLESASKLLHQLMNYSGCTLHQLKNNEFDLTLWQKLENDLERRHRYILSFWYSTLHVQLFAKCTVKTRSLRKMICKRLQKKTQYRIWSDIRWKELVKEFPDGFTGMFLYGAARRMVVKYPNYLTTPLSKVLERALKDNLECPQRRLKMLRLSKKGHLKYTSYDIHFKRLMKPGSPD